MPLSTKATESDTGTILDAPPHDHDDENDLLRAMKTDLSRKGCSPFFVAVRKNKCVAIVTGADPPSIVTVVKEYAPQVKDEGGADKESANSDAVEE